MKITANIANKNYTVEHSKAIDISIPMLFNEKQPNSYNVPLATKKVYQDGEFIGDTRQGGGCNFEEYKFIPHCNGTHTECIGHITHKRISVFQQLKDTFIPATLISVTPVPAQSTPDTYLPEKEERDMLITAAAIKEAVKGVHLDFLKAIIIRTLPNEPTKKERQYMDELPPFLSIEAVELLVDLGVNHILVDMPSVDRTFDKGELNVHHIFWNMEKKSHELKKDSNTNFTITEMIYADNSIKDGQYLLNIQIPSFTADAAPSRPLLFGLKTQ